MLNRRICKKCFIKTNKENNRTIPAEWIVETFEENWKEDFVCCPVCFNVNVQINTKAGTGFLEKCPYILEHILQEQKLC